VTADSELRRRHPEQRLEPLRSAEPEPADEPPTSAGRAAFRERLQERQGVMVPAEDPDLEPLGEAWPGLHGRQRDAVLQPPKPDLRPSPQVTERLPDREAAG
jgi:hypothetical protein